MQLKSNIVFEVNTELPINIRIFDNEKELVNQYCMSGEYDIPFNINDCSPTDKGFDHIFKFQLSEKQKDKYCHLKINSLQLGDVNFINEYSYTKYLYEKAFIDDKNGCSEFSYILGDNQSLVFEFSSPFYLWAVYNIKQSISIENIIYKNL